jgi:hypothetical protein
MSSFQLYVTNTISEIDCISIKESVLAGCIPIISNFGVFEERDGIHYDFNDEKQAFGELSLTSSVDIRYFVTKGICIV